MANGKPIKSISPPMKSLCITAAIAILSARADAQCDFCSNGVSNPDFAIPDSGGQTCGSIDEFASSLEGDICDSFKIAELHCCADSVAGAADPCPFCPNGATPADYSFSMPDEADGMNCDFYVDYAKTLEKETEDCANVLALEFVCCSPEVTKPCSVCPDGATVGDDVILDSDSEDSVTCGQMIEYAKMIETETDMCVGFQGAEMICCPSPAENPCPICSEGLTVDEGTDIPDADGVTCGALVEYALNTEEDAEMCDDFKEAESVCCPASSVESKSKAAKSSPSMALRSSKVGKQAKSHAQRSKVGKQAKSNIR